MAMSLSVADEGGEIAGAKGIAGIAADGAHAQKYSVYSDFIVNTLGR